MAPAETETYEIGVGVEACLTAKDLKEYMYPRQRAKRARQEARQQQAKQAQADQIVQLMTPIKITAERLANFMTRPRPPRPPSLSCG